MTWKKTGRRGLPVDLLKRSTVKVFVQIIKYCSNHRVVFIIFYMHFKQDTKVNHISFYFFLTRI